LQRVVLLTAAADPTAATSEQRSCSREDLFLEQRSCLNRPAEDKHVPFSKQRPKRLAAVLIPAVYCLPRVQHRRASYSIAGGDFISRQHSLCQRRCWNISLPSYCCILLAQCFKPEVKTWHPHQPMPADPDPLLRIEVLKTRVQFGRIRIQVRDKCLKPAP
jgi:hypothetical protein